MNTREKKRLLDDYLDLYRIAGSMNDSDWQIDIERKLVAILEGRDLFGEQKKALQQQFIEINRQILLIFQRMHRGEDQDKSLSLKLFALKQRRFELSREIDQIKTFQ